ncbi:entericidin A/B family lipoprotein [Sphingobium sp. CR2-8]|nr:entericidin A/B family lipoprotein [Sphingobium sp. CR2-8]MEC3909690.1 entericidin A/B family lipoprotein [Sphingobium sp. CR2-8]
MTKIAFAVTTLAALGLTACNTVEGAGKDLRSAGSAVSQASGQSGKSK